MPRQAVEAPRSRVPRYSLLIAAPTITDGARWEAGVQFAPEGCGEAGRVPVDCIGSTEQLVAPENPDWVTADAFAVWGVDQCSTFGLRARDYAGRARRQLEAGQSFQIAAELWSGSMVGDPIMLSGGTTVNENVPLNAITSDTVTPSAQTPQDALAMVVDALGRCGQGRQGAVHMRAQVLQQLVTNGSVYRDSGLWYTAMGHLVIADDGYDGSGPGNVPAVSTQWIYGTQIPEVRLGEIQIVPNLAEQSPAGDAIGWDAAVDPYTNLVTVYAQRLALVEWDPCCHIAAEVALPIPLSGGVS